MIVVGWLMTVLLAVMSGAPASGSNPPSGDSLAVASATTAGLPSWDIPITVNESVDRWLLYYQTKGREHFQVHLDRMGRYEPMIRATLRDHDLPEDLVYLSMIESGFDPNAYSRAHAVGLWQFIRSTGRRHGLRISYWIDERRDPLRSTRAAAEHLSVLYDEFGSWYLAAAAYNGGSGRVRRSIQRSKSRNFWSLARRKYLRPETREYVPKLIAAALIAKQPERYGFSVRPAPRLAYDVVQVPDATGLDVIAEAAGVSVDEINALNPQLLRGITPPGEKYFVRLPPGNAGMFAVNFASIPESERVRAIQHTVRRGDTLARIAKVYGSDLSAIRAANQNVHPRRLRIGQRLVVPTGVKTTRLTSATD